jgi:hypothetical protein
MLYICGDVLDMVHHYTGLRSPYSSILWTVFYGDILRNMFVTFWWWCLEDSVAVLNDDALQLVGITGLTRQFLH